MADTSTSKRRISSGDFDTVAKYIVEEKQRRAGAAIRKDKEKIWKEVDRQVAMTPVARKTEDGKSMAAWMPNLELPLQAQTLEVLTADARRLMFPDNRDWFSARAAGEDALLLKLESKGLIGGDDAQIPSAINQDNLDVMVEGSLNHYHRMYDFRGVWDSLNAEAMKYGTFVGRARLLRDSTFTNEFRGVVAKNRRRPMLVARSIKSTYLDDTLHAVMHEGQIVAPAIIEVYTQKLEDLQKAAKKGSSDPTREDGGWIKGVVSGLEAMKKGVNSIELVDFEGDLLVPRNRGAAIFVPNLMITAAVSSGGPKLVRVREREFPFRSYISGTYHRPDVNSPYGDGPLMMGSPVHKAATEALNATMQAGILNVNPPLVWSPEDQYLQAEGGPVVEPGASWQAQSGVTPQQIGEPGALSATLFALVKFYEEVTGVTSPRLGGQTKSHQTAFAVDTETTRGQVRTVDYVRSLMFAALPTWLSMEYEMVKKVLSSDLVYLDKYHGYAKLSGADLPETVTFDVHGAAGPLEEREIAQRRQQAIQQVLQIEQARVQLGGAPMNLEELQRQILLEGGFPDVDPFFNRDDTGAQGGVAGGPAPVEAGPGLVQGGQGNPPQAVAGLGG